METIHIARLVYYFRLRLATNGDPNKTKNFDVKIAAKVQQKAKGTKVLPSAP